ncbi:hypothetical protein [Sneathiella sp.]|jgi:hypothetical protein|uniref:hypothetical protein n=1 Tax=Sneathiella sp. TaxID=1964365 RepID=UPI0039E2E424
MRQIATFAVTATLTTLIAAQSHAIKPATQGLNINQEISVHDVGTVPTITVRNTSANKQLSALSLQTEKNSIQIKMKGEVECGGTYFENYRKREGYAFKEGRLGVGTEEDIYWDVQAGTSNNINKSSHAITKTLTVNLAHFNGTEHEINAAAYVLQKANQHAGNGGNKINYLRQDHVYNVKVPIRFQADCRKFTRYKIKKETVIESGADNIVATRLINVKIAYKGDKNLTGSLSAQLIPSQGQGNTINAGPQNFISVDSGTFLEGIKKLKGKCVLEPSFKIELKGSGDGQVKIRINDGSSTIYDSAPVTFSKGKAVLTFSKKVGLPGSNQLNKTYQHEYQVYVRTKTNNEEQFPAAFQIVHGAALDWEHTCIQPVVVNPAIGNTGSKVFAPNTPQPTPARKIN